MAIMAQGCCIVVIRIKIMNWSAICWYQLYLIVTHHRSDSIGHGVTSCRKYSLRNLAMAGNMQIQVSINPNRNLQKGTLTQKPRLGRPWQSTLEDGRLDGRTKSASAPREEWQQPTNVPLFRRLINNRLVQAEHYERCPWSKHPSENALFSSQGGWAGGLRFGYVICDIKR